MVKKSTEEEIKFWTSFFIGITFSYFIWVSWLKLTELIGDSNWVWIITGLIVLIGIILGHFSVKTILKRFYS